MTTDSSTDIVNEPVTAESVRARAQEEIKAQRRERWQLLLRKPTFVMGVIITGFWLLCAFFGTVIAPQDPGAQDLFHKLKGPSAKHWFGTDNLGRDVFSRVIIGARVIVFVALGATIATRNTKHFVHFGAPLSGFQGVLTGVPRSLDGAPGQAAQ